LFTETKALKAKERRFIKSKSLVAAAAGSGCASCGASSQSLRPSRRN